LSESKSLYHRYNPLKNQRTRLEHLQAAKLYNAKSNIDARNSTDKHKTGPSWPARGVLDDLDINGPFKGSEEGEEVYMILNSYSDDEAEDSARMTRASCSFPKEHSFNTTVDYVSNGKLSSITHR
jgi:hypothetical protein